MEDIIDLIFQDAGSSQVTDAIKDALYSKSAEKIDALRPVAAASLFGNEPIETAIEEPGEE
jgi:hypothetical protein